MKPSDKDKTLSGEEIFKLIDNNDAEKISLLDDFEREAAEGLKLVKNRDRLKKIHERIDEELKEKKKNRGIIFWMSAAASLVLVVGLIYLIAPHFKKVNEVAAADATKTNQETPIITSDEKLDPSAEKKEITITTATDSVSATNLFPREENNVKALEKSSDEEKLKADKNGYFKSENKLQDQQLSTVYQSKDITDKKVIDEEAADDRSYKKEESKQKTTTYYDLSDNTQSNMGAGGNKGTFELKKEEERESQTKNPNVVTNGLINTNSQATTNAGSNTGVNFTTTISKKENLQQSSPKKDVQNNNSNKNNTQAVNNENTDNNFGLAGYNSSPYVQNQEDKDKHEDIVTDQVVVTEKNKNVSNTTPNANVSSGTTVVTTSPMYNPSGYNNALAENKSGKKNTKADEKVKDSKKKSKEQSETLTQQAVTVNQGFTSGESVVADTIKEVAAKVLDEVEQTKSPNGNQVKNGELVNDGTIAGNTNPQFPGGSSAMQKFLRDNIKKPAADKNVSGKVDVSFLVGKDGSVSDIKILKSISGCNECTKEVIRVIKIMPKWNPATSGGKPVAVRYNLPVNF